MFTRTVLGIALIISAAVIAAIAQDNPETKRDNLELRLEAEDIQGGIPQAFVFLLVNKSDHDIRVPTPAIECEDPAYDGTFWLKVNFKPSRPDENGSGYGCANDRTDKRSILDRVKTWKNLRPGESIVLKVARERLGYSCKEPGTYEFSASYFPPAMTPNDRKVLSQTGIDSPHSKLTTTRVTFVKNS
jgi:hypothetical protein